MKQKQTITSLSFKQLILAATCWLAICWQSLAQDLSSLSFATEEYPPYNFTESGKLQGFAVDLLVAVTKQVKQPITADKIDVWPWSRGYRSLQQGPNFVLFSTTRTEERDPQFKWAGPITQTRIVVLAHKKDGITISKAEDLANHSIIAIRDDVGEQLIKALNIPKLKLRTASKANQALAAFAEGKVKLWAYEENVARWLLKAAGHQGADFDTAYVLKEGELYYAFSQSVDDALVNSLQQGIDTVKASSEFESISKKYFK